MRYSLIVAALALSIPAVAQAEPGGCLKYGAAGAVGGHFVHHHAILGAAGGCAVGMMRRHAYRRDQAAQQGYGTQGNGSNYQ